MFGNEVFSDQLLFSFQTFLSEYHHSVDQAEIFRARAKLFNKLLNEQSGEDVNSNIADQVRYLGRRVPRSERALRYSAMGSMDNVNQVAFDWFYDVDVSAAAWGPLHHAMNHSSYNRIWKRSTNGALSQGAAYIRD